MAPEDDVGVPDIPERLRRHLDEVFGDVLPVTTSDERGDDPAGEPDPDAALLADRPPHHDREQ